MGLFFTSRIWLTAMRCRDLDPLNVEQSHGRPPCAYELVSCPFDERGMATVNPGPTCMADGINV